MNNLLNIFVFIGPPGGGKGSLSKLCVEQLGWLQLSTGNLCRSHIANKTEIGKTIDFIIKSGKLISDNIMTDMVDQWLNSNSGLKSSIIFDGYPRTVQQAKAIKQLLETKFVNHKLNIIKLEVDEQIVIKRLSSRIVCGNNECQSVYSTITSGLIPNNLNICDKCNSSLIKRHDDDEKAVKERLSIYNKHEEDLINYYSQIGQNVLKLNVEQPINIVFNEFKKLILI